MAWMIRLPGTGYVQRTAMETQLQITTPGMRGSKRADTEQRRPRRSRRWRRAEEARPTVWADPSRSTGFIRCSSSSPGCSSQRPRRGAVDRARPPRHRAVRERSGQRARSRLAGGAPDAGPDRRLAGRLDRRGRGRVADHRRRGRRSSAVAAAAVAGRCVRRLRAGRRVRVVPDDTLVVHSDRPRVVRLETYRSTPVTRPALRRRTIAVYGGLALLLTSEIHHLPFPGLCLGGRRR